MDEKVVKKVRVNNLSFKDLSPESKMNILELFFFLPDWSMNMDWLSFFGILDRVTRKIEMIFPSIGVRDQVILEMLPWNRVQVLMFNPPCHVPVKYLTHGTKLNRLHNVRVKTEVELELITTLKLKMCSFVLEGDMSLLSTKQILVYSKKIPNVRIFRRLSNKQIVEVNLKARKRRRGRKKRKVSKPKVESKMKEFVVLIPDEFLEGVKEKNGEYLPIGVEFPPGVSWKSGMKITAGSILCSVFCKKPDGTKGEMVKIFTENDGEIQEVCMGCKGLVGGMDYFEQDVRLFRLRACDHPEIVFGMCVICNMVMKDTTSGSPDRGRSFVNFIHGDPNIKVSTSEALFIDSERQHDLLMKKKLILILDLDHTLLHCTNFYLAHRWRAQKSDEEVAKLDIHVFRLHGERHMVKIRPGVREFLEKMHGLFELHVWTLGTRNYALKIQKILDPQKKYFEDRIVSREECPNLVKTLREKFPSSIDRIMVADDSRNVWREHLEHLYKVNPFRYFVTEKEVNNEPGKSEMDGTPKMDDVGRMDLKKYSGVMNKRAEEWAKDPQIRLLSEVFEEVHREFFSNANKEEILMKKVQPLLGHAIKEQRKRIRIPV